MMRRLLLLLAFLLPAAALAQATSTRYVSQPLYIDGPFTVADVANCVGASGFALATDGTGKVVCQSIATGSSGDLVCTGCVGTTDVANDAITFAKMQNITTDRLIGRDTTGTGDPEEIAVGGGLEFTGSLGIQRSATTGDVVCPAGSNACTVQADSVALGTDTTGSYAAGDAEAGNATGLVCSGVCVSPSELDVSAAYAWTPGPWGS